MIWFQPFPLIVLQQHHWVFLGIVVPATLVAITTISVALINRSTGRQEKKDATAVETVAELTTSLSAEREKTSGLQSEVNTLKAENRRLWKLIEKQTP